MKPIALLLPIFFLAVHGGAQPLNWGNDHPESRHLIQLNAGLDYGLTFGVGYGYRLNTKLPILLSADYSFPSGEKLTDDFKTRIGGQIGLLSGDRFRVNARLQGVFRRYQNEFARILNFGSDMGLTAGYYRPGWFVAAETGFDKAIVSHFRHSPAYRENYPSVEDGWYQPATGGNFYYGLQAGFSVKKSDITLRAGRILTQDFRTGPTVPLYLQLGYTGRF